MTQQGGETTTRGARAAVRRARTAAFRRAIGLTALATLLPGAGLTRARSRRIGWAILFIFLASLAWVAWFVGRRGIKNAGLYVLGRPEWLGRITIALVALGLVWAASIVATAVQAKPEWLDRSRNRSLRLFTTLMVAVVALGTGVPAAYSYVTKDTIDSLFKTSAKAKPGEGAKVIDEPDVDPWRDTPRINILIIGSDAGKGRVGTRTDSMIVASIDTKTGRTVLIQLPRSLERAPLAQDSPLRALYPSGTFGIPKSTCNAQMGGDHECLLTHLWRQADFFKADNPNAYQDVEEPGRWEIRKTIELATGLKIDQQIIVSLRGFEQLINAMGGVDITVKGGGYDGKSRIPIGGKSDGRGGVMNEVGWFEFGRQRMDGFHALWYARARAIDDDTNRQSRQRCVVRAIVEQVNPAKMFAKYAEIAKIAQNNIWTDIPGEHLPAYVDLLARVQKGKLVSLPLTPAKKVYAGNPDYDLIHKLVTTSLTPPKPPKTAAKPTTPPTVKPGAQTPSATATKPPPDGEVDECD